MSEYDDGAYDGIGPRRLTPRGRAISWIGGLLGLVLLIAFAVWLSHRAASDSGQGSGGGRQGGRGGGGGGFGPFGGGGGGAQTTTVGTAKVATADLAVQVEALGTVTPAATVTVRPQVSGTITELHYREGQMVRRGQLLAVIDPRPYQAALLQARGALIRDQAQLENARVQLARYDTLLKEDSIARQDRDTQSALVHQLTGTIAVDRGAVQNAQINVGYTRIVAPVAGRVGLKVVDVGNYIGAGDANGVVVVTTLQPIDVEFAVPQQQAPQIQQRIAQGAEITAVALDSTRTHTLDEGHFSTLDNRVDTTTGTIKGKARFGNAQFQLYPSQFVNVRLTVNTVAGAVTVPPAAVRSGPDGSFVWLLKPDRTVTQRKVKTGVATGDKVQVTDGLQLGETVVTDGGDRLSEGAKVALPGDKPAAGGKGTGGSGRRRRGGLIADPMGPSRLFILRPVATALFMVAIVLAGLVGFRLLSLSALPEVDYPTIQVTTLYPGGSPEVMSQTVTAPLERQFGQMPGLSRMESTSSSGASIVTLQFTLTQSLDVAEQEVQAAINASQALLPADLPAPPVYAKVNPADAPVLTIAVTSDTMPLTQVQSIVDTRLAQKIAQISGVGLVGLAGGQKPAMRIRADTQKLASYGLSLSQLRTAITNANANAAKGSFDGPNRSYQINSNDQLESVDDYKNLIVTYQNAAPVRLGDVAQVVEGAENSRLGALANRTPAIILNVQRQPGANVIATTDAIKRTLPSLLQSLPAGLHATVLADRTTGIRASVEDVEFELVLAVVLVILVIFFFLHSARATLVAGLAVPISLVGTFGVMYLLNYSLDNLSLMALTIATGFVVDDAIVMIENIQRHIEDGMKPFEAALKGAGEIGFTIISLTVSLIAVLIPLLFMGDIVGRLFREFAVTLAVTILISAVVSLTLTPMLSARWLKAPEDERPSRVAEKSKELFARVEHHYTRGLDWVLARRFATLMVAVATFVVTVLLYLVIPKGLFPVQDTGQLQARLVATTGVSYAKMADLQARAADVILQDKDVQSLSSFVGVDGSNNASLNAGTMLVNLASGHGNQATAMRRLKHAVDSQVAGVQLYLQPTQDLTIDAESGPTMYRFSVQGSNTADVTAESKRIVAALRDVGKVANVSTSAGATGPAAYINVNRDTAARLNITASSVDDTLYSAFGQRIVSTIFTETTQYRVILEAVPGLVTDPASLGLLHVQAQGGATPLGSIANVTEGTSPLAVTHVGQFPAATVNFDTAPGVSLGTATSAIQTAVDKLKLKPGVTITFLGASGAFGNSLTNQLWLILAAVVCVYIVLGVLYESFIHPLTILSTLPSAGAGALFALWITGHDLDIIGIIGIVLLIGIVKKNAIMMIDFAIAAERDEGLAPAAAIRQAAILRFRPILMTTLAALFAAVPLMIGFGQGAELRRPLGIAIFGGLIVSQMLTIFTTPIVYLYFDRAQQRLARRGWGVKASPNVGPETDGPVAMGSAGA